MFESGRCKIPRAAPQREDLRRKRTSKRGKDSFTTAKKAEKLFYFSPNFHIYFIFTSHFKRIFMLEARCACPRFLLIEKERKKK